jgi:hypothetical protein
VVSRALRHLLASAWNVTRPASTRRVISEAVSILRAVVDYLDLHLLGTGILLQNASQRLLQVIRSRTVRRNHYGPERGRHSSTGNTRIAGGLGLLAVCHLFDDIVQQITVQQKGNEFMRVFYKLVSLAQKPDTRET